MSRRQTFLFILDVATMSALLLCLLVQKSLLESVVVTQPHVA